MRKAFLPRRLKVICDQRLTIIHQRELGRRPAHIEGQHVAVTVVGTEPSAGQSAGSGAAFQQSDRRLLRLLQRAEAAVGEHQLQRCGNAQPGQILGQPVQIGRGQRLDIGVNHRG